MADSSEMQRTTRNSVPQDGFDCVYLYENGVEVGCLNGPQNDPKVIDRAKHWERAASVKAGEVVAWRFDHADGRHSYYSDPPSPGLLKQCTPLYAAAPTASVGAMREALEDCRTHYDAWRGAIEAARDNAPDEADESYWRHELKAFERTFADLAANQSDVEALAATTAERPGTVTSEPEPSTSDPFAGKVPCHCYDPVSQRLCLDRDRCYTIEAAAGVAPGPSGSMYGDYTPVTVRASATPPAPTPGAARALPANRIWFDTEFIEDGTTIDLISIGMVRSDGATYYAETDQWIPGKASQWVRDNVIVHLKGGDSIKSRDVIAREIVEFAGEKPEFWAYYADYDWVALCQLFGTMMQLPDGWPMFCRDIKQWAVDVGNPKLPEQTSTEHHALADALWNKEAWDFLSSLPDAAAIRAAAFDFRAHLQRQREWSERTFGPGPRTKGVCDHIRKELAEIEAAPDDVEEWIDVVILALDGAWRAGASPETIIMRIVGKQTKNEARNWPDWRTADPDKAIEHVRAAAAIRAAGEK
jgi:hypothetical protein